MEEHPFFTKVLWDFYRISPTQLDLLNSSSLEDRKVYQMYRIEHPGMTQVLFAYHDDFITTPTFPWTSNQPLEKWLRQRAVLLRYLAEQHYPAPCVLLSQSGALIAKSKPWSFLVTSYIDGDANVLSSENIFQIANALGHLHRIQFPHEEQVGPSWWNDYSIAHAMENFASAAAFAPLLQRNLCGKMQKTLVNVQQKLGTLPNVLIHGDCWAPNSVHTKSHDVILIDWECAGRGAAILDLGVLLLRSQYDQDGNIPEKIDTQQITSVIAGYTQWRRLSLQEEDMLLEAIRFGIIWGGAWIVSRTIREGWTPRIEQLLARIQRGYDLAEQIARFAQTHLPGRS